MIIDHVCVYVFSTRFCIAVDITFTKQKSFEWHLIRSTKTSSIQPFHNIYENFTIKYIVMQRDPLVWPCILYTYLIISLRVMSHEDPRRTCIHNKTTRLNIQGLQHNIYVHLIILIYIGRWEGGISYPFNWGKRRYVMNAVQTPLCRENECMSSKCWYVIQSSLKTFL